MTWIAIFAALMAAGYLVGSIPFGVIIGRKFKGIDLREIGSGNIGTANAIRTLGPFWGITVFVGDVLKGVIPVLLSVYIPKWFPGTIPSNLQPICTVLVGLSPIIGHNNSIFLGFKGGKGIATSFGVFVALNWQSALSAIAVWGAIVLVTGIASLGSIVGAVSAPFFMAFYKQPAVYVIFCACAAILAVYKHKDNIGRLLRGQERKIIESKKSERSQVNGERNNR